MNLKKRFFTAKRALLSLFLFSFGLGILINSVTEVHAVANSVLPSAGSDFECSIYEVISPDELQAEFEKDATKWSNALGCAIKSGQIKFWMIPYFVNYILEFMITTAGVLVVLMIVIGGYYYIAGAVTDDKEKGKTIISYALGGYALVLSAWFIVNTLLLALTA
jgi:Type IV secretion system pilin